MTVLGIADIVMVIVATPGLADVALLPLLATMGRSKEFGVATKQT